MTLAVSNDYKFDAFISYSHNPVIKPWVTEVLHRYLENWLTIKLQGSPANIYVDKADIKPGQRWPQRLRDALLVSKCLVPVFSGDYFFSQWCSSEWSYFIERQKIERYYDSAETLIVPITHDDGRWLVEEAKEYVPIDFSQCRSTSPNFSNHPNFHLFEKNVERLAEAVANVVQNAPPFNPNWPKLEFGPLRILPLKKLVG